MNEYPLVLSLTDQEFMQQVQGFKNTDLWSLVFGSAYIGLSSFILAHMHSRFFILKHFYPLTIPQQYWAKMMCAKTPVVAVMLFLYHQGLSNYVGLISDDLKQENNLSITNEPRPHGIPTRYLREQAREHFGWDDHESSKTKALLMIVHLTRIPLYFFCLAVSPFSLLTTLFPYRVKDNLPPTKLLSVISAAEYYEQHLFTDPSKPDPTPNDLDMILRGNADKHKDMIARLAQVSSTLQ
jgi:hypothetical protein